MKPTCLTIVILTLAPAVLRLSAQQVEIEQKAIEAAKAKPESNTITEVKSAKGNSQTVLLTNMPNCRPFTEAEIAYLARQGYDMSAYHGEAVMPTNTPPPQSSASATPADLKNAIVYLERFSGVTNLVLNADVISVKCDSLKFRFGEKDFEYSGRFSIVLTKARQHKSPLLGFGSFETAKSVTLEDFHGMSMPVPNPTIVEKGKGFIDVLSDGQEWIHSGPYSIQK